MFVVLKHIQRNLKNFIDNKSYSIMSSRLNRKATDLPLLDVFETSKVG